ncbi:MAG: hypothetical protein ACRDQ5_06630, partial [Sciscionella sp.]
MPPPHKRSPRPYPQPTRRQKVAGTTDRSTEATSVEDTEQVGPTGRGFDLVTGVDASKHDTTGNGAATTIPVGTIPAGGELTDTDKSIRTHEPTTGKGVGAALLAGVRLRGSTPETTSVTTTGTEDAAANRESRKLKITAGLVVLAVVLVGLAIWFRAEANGVTSGADAGNTALSDAATTKAVQEQVGNDLSTIMSYNYKHPDRTTKVAKAALGANDFANDYSQIINVLEANGVKQKLSLRTRVMTSGVERLDGNRAVV